MFCKHPNHLSLFNIFPILMFKPLDKVDYIFTFTSSVLKESSLIPPEDDIEHGGYLWLLTLKTHLSLTT